MRVELDELAGLLREVLGRQGVPEGEAAVGAEVLLDAELRGHTSHGVRLVRNVLGEYVRGAGRRRPVSLLQETPVSARVDGGYHLSLYTHRYAVDLAARKAEESGIGLVSVSDCGVSGALGHLVERIAVRGLVALAFNSSPVVVVAPAAAVPSLGTNPLAIGVPRQGAPPLVLDMATSAIAYNEVVRRRETGDGLPHGVANGADGTPTTDPAAAIDPATGRGRILPFGGHRGYGLALMVELLASGGVTGRVAGDKRGPIVGEPADFSGLYLAYQPGLVGDPERAAAATDRLVNELEDFGARVPGEVGRRRRERCLAEGVVDVDDAALHTLEQLRTAPPA